MLLEGNQYVRLTNLVRYLTEGDGRKMKYLAELVAMSERNAYRYVELLRDVGFEVRRNAHCEYSIAECPAVDDEVENDVFNPSERDVCMTSSIIRGMCFSVPGADRADREFQRGMGQRFGAIALRSAGVMESELGYAGKVSAINRSIREKRQVDVVDYASGRSNRLKQYRVEAVRIFGDMKYVQVIGVADSRTFTLKISRMGQVKIRDDPWVHERLHGKDIGDIFDMHGTEEYRVDLKLDVMSRSLLEDEFPRSRRYVEEARDGPHLRTTVHDLRAVGRFVIGLADHIEIVDSPELQEYVKEFVRKHLLDYLHY